MFTAKAYFQVASKSKDYAKYNREIAARLQEQENRDYFQQKFGQHDLEEIITGYELIATAIEENELLVIKFLAER